MLVVNGQPHEFPAGTTVAGVIEALDGAPQGRGVAVAVDGEVVPRGQWQQTELSDGAHVEIVVAVQGG
jgi:sulfur carrier protein